MMRGGGALLLFSLVGFVCRVDSLCYLEDSNSDCAVCWTTVYENEDSLGVTTADVCPPGITAKWNQIPSHMVEGMAYPVSFTVEINSTQHNVLRHENWEIPHANIHSCIASRGACTPFVSDTPGLATHTPAMMSDLNSAGKAMFTTEIVLSQDLYTIIAHVRLHLPVEPTSRLVHEKRSRQLIRTIDLAVGVTRTVESANSMCEAGSVPIEGQCQPCPEGTHQTGNGCTPCEPGTFGPMAGLSTCYPCQGGFAQEYGMRECTPCPENTQRLPGSAGVDLSECLCKYGFYQRNSTDPEHTGITCAACPAGAECQGFYAMPYPKPNFWGDRSCKQYGGDADCPEDAWDSFMECNPESNCVGGVDFECEEGRTGRMCLDPADGWFIVGDEWFFQCGKYGKYITVVGIMLVVACWVLIEVLFGHSHPAFSTALLFVQVTAMIGTYGLRWHAYLQPLNTALSIADFDVDFVSPWCLGEWSHVSSFYLQLSLPFVFAASCAGYHCLRNAWEYRDRLQVLWAEVSEMLMVKFLMVNVIIYHTLAVKCFEVFSCERFPDGRSYMPSAPSVECGTSLHDGMVATAYLYIPVVLAGTPTFIFWILNKHIRDGTLHTKDAVRRWAWLHRPYEAHCKHWELLLLARRGLVALVASTLDASMLQGAITIIALTSLLAAHVFARPYISANIDVLDFFSIAGSILHVLAGMLMYSDITPEASSLLCAGGISDERCRQEEMYKRVVATISVTLVLSTIAVAASLAFWVVRESTNSQAAAKIIFQRLKADCLHRYQMDFPDVQDTKNMVELEQILEGSYLLRWARTMDHTTISKDSLLYKRSEESYMMVDKGVRQLEEDVTQFSKSKKAEILRALCEIPGLIEMLCWKGNAGRESLSQFLDTMSAFATEAQADKRPFPITDIVRFENRPVIALWLLQCSEEDRQHYSMLMDAILTANNVDPDTSARHQILHDNIVENLGYAGSELDAEQRDQLCGLPDEDSIVRNRLGSMESVRSGRQPSFSASLFFSSESLAESTPSQHRPPSLTGFNGWRTSSGPTISTSPWHRESDGSTPSNVEKYASNPWHRPSSDPWRTASNPSLLSHPPGPVTDFGVHWENLRVLPLGRRRTGSTATPRSTLTRASSRSPKGSSRRGWYAGESSRTVLATSVSSKVSPAAPSDSDRDSAHTTQPELDSTSSCASDATRTEDFRRTSEHTAGLEPAACTEGDHAAFLRAVVMGTPIDQICADRLASTPALDPDDGEPGVGIC